MRAVVGRQKAQTQNPYHIWVVLHKQKGTVETGYCSCPAGLRGYCKHVCALLHFIVRQVEGGCNLACTSKPQVWHKPHTAGEKIHQPDFAKNLQIHKVKGTYNSETSQLKPNRVIFDPRAIVYRKKKTLSDFNLSKLEEITNGNCGVLLYSRRAATPQEPEIDNIQVEVETSTETIPSIAQQVQTIVETIPLIAEEIKVNNISKENFEEDVMSRLNAITTDDSIKYVINETEKQRLADQWFAYRQARITASNVNECVKKVNANGEITGSSVSLVSKICNYTTVPDNVKSIRWGRQQEPYAIKQYSQIQQKKHDEFVIQNTGLHISKQHPWLAGTPDSLISCKCCGNGCLEVKNPFRLQNETIHSIVGCVCRTQNQSKCGPSGTSMKYSLVMSDNCEIHLKRTDNYYAQVQCQMFVTDTNYVDFVVKTVADTDNIFIERIVLDMPFIENMIYKSEIFYRKAIIVELYTGAIKSKLKADKKTLKPLDFSDSIENLEPTINSETKTEDQFITEDVTALTKTDLDVDDEHKLDSDVEVFVCPICDNICSDDPKSKMEESVSCSKCDNWFHYHCANIKGNEKFITSARCKWFCHLCKQSTTTKSKSEMCTRSKMN